MVSFVSRYMQNFGVEALVSHKKQENTIHNVKVKRSVSEQRIQALGETGCIGVNVHTKVLFKAKFGDGRRKL